MMEANKAIAEIKSVAVTENSDKNFGCVTLRKAPRG